jgi:4a-hydroxytetrahydrobiopterin dehydratase
MDPFKPEDLPAAIGGLDPAWSIGPDGRSIRRTLEFADFDAAFAFMTAVAAEAKAADHHPDWSNSWATVEITLSTHSDGGVTGKDLALAATIDEHATAGGVKAAS